MGLQLAGDVGVLLFAVIVAVVVVRVGKGEGYIYKYIRIH